MRKSWEFDLAGHEIRVTNSWIHGLKLYVDGECRDRDSSLFLLNNALVLSANLGEAGILEIECEAWLTVEIKAYLKKATGRKRTKIFASQTKLRDLLPGFR